MTTYATKRAEHTAITENQSTTNATVTQHVFTFTACPTRMMQRIVNMSVINQNSAYTWAITKSVAGVPWSVHNEYAVQPLNTVDNWNGEVILGATDYIKIYINGTVAGDDCAAVIHGEQWFV